MDEAQLTEIEERSQRFTSANEAEYLGIPELIAEVRRLRGVIDDLADTVEALDYQVQTR